MKNQKGVSLITLIITIIIVIILAVIVLRSGASDAPDQAAFSKFASQMGELQDAVKIAMLEAKNDELMKGNSRTEEQLYNFVARGGYKGFEYEREYGKELDEEAEKGNHTAKILDENKWILQGEIQQIACTQINKACAKNSIGMKLPVIKVETAIGMEEELTFFVTGKGTVFCWPPYVYDGKSYVNANTTVKKGDYVDSNGNLVRGTQEEYSGTEATELENQIGKNKYSKRAVVFSEDEYVGIQNGGADSDTTVYRYGVDYMDDNFDELLYSKQYFMKPNDNSVLYFDSYEYTEHRNNISYRGLKEPDKVKEARGAAKGYDFYNYANNNIDINVQESGS